MKELVEVIAKSLVEHPDEVVVTENEKEDAVIIELKVGPSDMGKVIGRQGRIAKAIRTVVFKEQQKGDCRYSAIITKRSCGDIAPFLKGVFYGRFIKSWRDHHDTRCTWRSQSLPYHR